MSEVINELAAGSPRTRDGLDAAIGRALGLALVVAGLSLSGPAACRPVGEPMPALTSDQRALVAEHLLDEVPEMEHPLGISFDGKFELLGYDFGGDVVETGGPFTITWYWRCIEATNAGWQIFVHVDGGDHRQNLDHVPIDGLYDTRYWRAGQIIRDVQSAQLDAAMNPGPVGVYLGFWRPGSENRLPVSRLGAGLLQQDGRVLVASFEARRPLVLLEAHARNRPIAVDGELREAGWRRAVQSDPFVHHADGSPVDGSETRVQVAWDYDALYVGISAADTDIWATQDEADGNLRDEEIFGVVLDPLGDARNYVEIQINPLGTVFDALYERFDEDAAAAEHEREHDLEGLQTAVSVSPPDALSDRRNRDTSWTAELRIPFSALPDLGEDLADGVVLNANFYRYDRPADGRPVVTLWAPTYGDPLQAAPRSSEIHLVGEPSRAAAPEGARQQTPTRGVESGSPATGDLPSLEGRTLQLRRPMIPGELRPVGTSMTR